MNEESEIYFKNKFQFPECWKNDVRMGALFAPFRSKNLNPNDWTSKMKFWTDLIEDWCKHNKCPAVNMHVLKKEFSRNGMEPACLADVFENLNSSGIIVSKDRFMQDDKSWSSWAVRSLVAKPVKWTLNTVKYVLGTKNEQDHVIFIHVPVIKHWGDKLIKQIPESLRGQVCTRNDLMKLWNIENPENFLILLHWLQKQGLIAVSTNKDFNLVKFSKSEEKQVTFTETDLGIWKLKKQAAILEKNIEKLEEEKNAAIVETKKHLGNKMKNLAKMSLRRKKEIEKTIEKRMATLDNIQGVLHRIDQLSLDCEIIECYRTGVATLNKVFEESGLKEVDVATTLEDLERTLNLGLEVEEALSQPLNASLEKSLESELSELLLESLPEVPEGRPESGQFHSQKKKKNDLGTEDLKRQMESLTL